MSAMSFENKMYKLTDFYQKNNDGFTYSVPTNVIGTVTDLMNKLNVKQPLGKTKYECKIPEKVISYSFRNMKKEEKSPIEKLINEVRIDVNKIANSNYEKILDKIKLNINEIQKLSIDTNDTEKDELYKNLGNIIYTITSSSKHYADCFAAVCIELCNEFEFISKEVKKNKKKFIDNLFNDFVWVDSNVDYDMYCEFTKKNEKRRTETSYLIEILKYILNRNELTTEQHVKNIITQNEILLLIQNILNKINNGINNSDKKNEIDEYTEILCILCKKEFINQTICNFIKNLSNKTPKENLGISSRTAYKLIQLNHDISH